MKVLENKKDQDKLEDLLYAETTRETLQKDPNLLLIHPKIKFVPDY